MPDNISFFVVTNKRKFLILLCIFFLPTKKEISEIFTKDFFVFNVENEENKTNIKY
jgi:hypothetical protein